MLSSSIENRLVIVPRTPDSRAILFKRIFIHTCGFPGKWKTVSSIIWYRCVKTQKNLPEGADMGKLGFKNGKGCGSLIKIKAESGSAEELVRGILYMG
ncbi:MAG: hypothetical protein K0S39_262 [Paenibacillus sp.]|jgi:hypothetical protein|nr:hypothetical protein [Paenibacillus sp.]